MLIDCHSASCNVRYCGPHSFVFIIICCSSITHNSQRLNTHAFFFERKTTMKIWKEYQYLVQTCWRQVFALLNLAVSLCGRRKRTEVVCSWNTSKTGSEELKYSIKKRATLNVYIQRQNTEIHPKPVHTDLNWISQQGACVQTHRNSLIRQTPRNTLKQ